MNAPTRIKLSFCITSMNRLYHIKETLKKNIDDNFLLNEVEFVLLDYNSTDGLEEWVKTEMWTYIESGILVYYKTFTPEYYHRSHSRNLAFRLSNGNIICNLDADNYLGKGFAKEMIKEFLTKEGIFYTSDFSFGDIYGRVLLLRKDFYAVYGYNESLNGYGSEDIDFFLRLNKYGLTQHMFYAPEFYNVIRHSRMERISNEESYEKLYDIYISYINPYTSNLIFMYNDYTYEYGTFIDNEYLNKLIEFKPNISNNPSAIDTDGVVLQSELIKGSWSELQDKILINIENQICSFAKNSLVFQTATQTFHKITEKELTISILLLRSTAVNVMESNKFHIDGKIINRDGFGKDTVYKNFIYSNPIIVN